MSTMINGLVMRRSRTNKPPEVDRRIMSITNLTLSTATGIYPNPWTPTPTRYTFYVAPVGNTLLSWKLRGTVKIVFTTDALVDVNGITVYWVLVREREGANGTFNAPLPLQTQDLYLPEAEVLAHGNAILCSEGTDTNTTGIYRCANFKAEGSVPRKLQEGDALRLIGYASTAPANTAIAYAFILDAMISN